MYSIDRELNIRGNKRGSNKGNCYSNAEGNSMLESQLKAQADVVKRTKSEWESAENEANSYKSTIKEGGYCASTYKTSARRRTCQAEVDAKYSTLASTAQAKRNTYDGAVSVLKQLEDRIANNEEARVSLAKQGKTPESVIAETQAVIKSQETAQEEFSNRKKIIVIGAVILAVGITGFILYKKYKK